MTVMTRKRHGQIQNELRDLRFFAMEISESKSATPIQKTMAERLEVLCGEIEKNTASVEDPYALTATRDALQIAQLVRTLLRRRTEKLRTAAVKRRKPLREKNRTATAKAERTRERWFAEAEKIRSKNPKLSNSAVAMRIVNAGLADNSDTVRKALAKRK